MSEPTTELTNGHEPGPGNLQADPRPLTALDRAWKELIAEALRRNVLAAVGKHRAAIEREAVAQEQARLRAAFEALPARGDMMALMVSRAAVLRVLDPEAEGGTDR